jgi:hypothetical protein
MNVSDEQILSALDTAPAAVREAASSVTTVKLVGSFIQKYGLHVDTVGKIAELNRALLLGFTSPAEFLGELVLAGVDANTARKIIGELNEKIFMPVQQQMRGSGASRPPMSKPQEPATPPPVQESSAPVQMPPPPMRTAPPPPDLPGAPEAQQPVTQPAPVAAPQPVAKPMPQMPQAPVQAPKPVSLPPIYSVETGMPAVPQTKPAPAGQVSVMWQTPVPSAWQKKEGASAAPMPVSIPMTPPEKVVPRTMESDMQLAAERAAAPQAPVTRPFAPQPIEIPIVQAPAYIGPPRAEPSILAAQTQAAMSAPGPKQVPVQAANQRTNAYVPPPRPVTEPRPVFSGDPYREPIEANAV